MPGGRDGAAESTRAEGGTAPGIDRRLEKEGCQSSFNATAFGVTFILGS